MRYASQRKIKFGKLLPTLETLEIANTNVSSKNIRQLFPLRLRALLHAALREVQLQLPEGGEGRQALAQALDGAVVHLGGHCCPTRAARTFSD